MALTSANIPAVPAPSTTEVGDATEFGDPLLQTDAELDLAPLDEPSSELVPQDELNLDVPPMETESFDESLTPNLNEELEEKPFVDPEMDAPNLDEAPFEEAPIEEAPFEEAPIEESPDSVLDTEEDTESDDDDDPFGGEDDDDPFGGEDDDDPFGEDEGSLSPGLDSSDQ